MSSQESTPSYSTPTLTPPPGVQEVAVASSSSTMSSTRPSSHSKMRADGTEYDEAELEAFRREWQNEVQCRRNQHTSPAGPSAPLPPRTPPRSGKAANRDQYRYSQSSVGQEYRHSVSSDSSSEEEAQPHSPSRTRHLLQLADEQRRAALREAQEQGSTLPPLIRSPPRQKLNQDAPANASASKKSQMKAAVEAYALGAEMERKGLLDQAVKHYRKAFQMDAAPDKLYERAKSLLHQDVSGSMSQTATSNWDAQWDALLASSEVGNMIRRTAEIDDFRVIAAQKRQAEVRHKGKVAQQSNDLGKYPTAKLPAVLPYNQSDPRVHEDNELDAIIANAAKSVGGRDLSCISFRGCPVPVKFAQQGSPPERDGEREGDISEAAEKFGQTRLYDEEPEEPPPPIARLPDEILALICRMVVEPRGIRGAKVRSLRVESPGTDKVQSGQTAMKGGDDKTGQERGKAASGVNETIATTRSAKTPAGVGVGVVLAGPDWQSLEVLARTSWKWRLASKTNDIWRLIVTETYRSPQLPLPSSPSELPNPRLLFIHHPRIRETGCYIAACHYSRPGLSVDNPWVQVIHVVEFYRSIRFLPDGRALTYLTTDSPRETVGKMWAGNTEKGFAVGRWRVELPDGEEGEEEEAAGIELEPKRKKRKSGGARVVIEDLKDRNMSRYAFRLVLSLSSTSRGRWNKMEILEYCSINLNTGEVLPLPQKHNRPFHFSTVRSYGI